MRQLPKSDLPGDTGRARSCTPSTTSCVSSPMAARAEQFAKNVTSQYDELFFPSLTLASTLGDRKHFLHSGEPEQFLNTRAHAGNAQSNPFALTPGVMAGQHAEAGRIHIRNSIQVKGVCRWGLIAGCRFEDVAKGIRR
jgi:hypothetical protein